MRFVTLKSLVVAAALASVAACAPAEVTRAPVPEDPYEAFNRQVHAFNKGLDQAALRPAAQAYGAVVPKPLRKGVSNFADNLALPGTVVNDLLQANLEDAVHNSFRFLVNSTLGLGGLADPAQSMKLEARHTDFGATLGAWGVPDGAYLELPGLGPSTERDLVGKVFDVVLDPTYWLLTPEQRRTLLATRVLGALDSRVTYGETVDSVLYDSADSYAQTRSLYLQNRAFGLGEASDDDYIDPYAQ